MLLTVVTRGTGTDKITGFSLPELYSDHPALNLQVHTTVCEFTIVHSPLHRVCVCRRATEKGSSSSPVRMLSATAPYSSSTPAGRIKLAEARVQCCALNHHHTVQARYAHLYAGHLLCVSSNEPYDASVSTTPKIASQSFMLPQWRTSYGGAVCSSIIYNTQLTLGIKELRFHRKVGSGFYSLFQGNAISSVDIP